MRFFIQVILLAFILTSCMEQEDIKMRELDIQISFEDDSNLSLFDGVEVEVKNVNTGRVFIKRVSQSIVSFSLEPGMYKASLSVEMDKSNYNAFLNDIKIADEKENEDKLIIKRSVYSPIIIKEIYYSGSFSKEGRVYMYDQFIEIYNNSNEIQNISGLCIASLKGTSFNNSTWRDRNGDLLPYLPIDKMIWSIPDNGGGNFLAPGESRVIAKNAINHSDPSLSDSSVNLENADYETYSECDGKDLDNTNVDNLDLVWLKSGCRNDWLMLINGSAIILFNIPGDKSDFADDERNIHVDSKEKSETICIPKEYVIDAVECVTSEQRHNKRLHVELDASYIFMSAIGDGFSVRRRVKDIIDGRVVYMDTSDSARDFLTDQVPMPGRNPLIIETK